MKRAALGLACAAALTSGPARAEENRPEPQSSQPADGAEPPSSAWQKQEANTLEQGAAWGPENQWPTRPTVLTSDTSPYNGAYGRLDGNLDVAVAVGGSFSGEAPGYAAYMSGHYFYVAGAYVLFTGSFNGDESPPTHLSAGVSLRPLFLPRFALDYEQGPPFLDLTLDSLSLGVGAYTRLSPDESFGALRGVELSLGGGIPLFGYAQGLWLIGKAFARWPTEQLGNPTAQWSGVVLLSWEQFFSI